MIPDSQIHLGHRERMRRKFSAYGDEIFDTYELLEMLLYTVIPVRDTNPLAKRLLAAFGGLDGVLSATKEELMSVDGVGATTAEYLTKVGSLPAALQNLENQLEDKFSNYEEMGEYLVDYFEGKESYTVAELLLDNSMRPIGIFEVFACDYGKGSVNCAPFLDLAISNRAACVVIAHNHPFGPLYPSHADLLTHKIIVDGFKHSGIELLDHYLVSGRGYMQIGEMVKRDGGIQRLLDEFGIVCVNNNVPSRNEIKSTKNKIQSELEFLEEFLAFSISDSERCHLVAERLVWQFHTLEGALSRSVDELAAYSSAGAAVCLKLLASVNSRRVTDKYRPGRKIGDWIYELLRWRFFGHSVEQVLLLLFDKNEKFLGVSKISEGTVNASDVVPRKAMEAATRVNAASAVMAHNHPGGVCVGSQSDVYATAIISRALANVGVELRGHLILAGADVGFVEVPELNKK